MTRGRQSRQAVATRVRNARDLKELYRSKPYLTEPQSSPSKAMRFMGEHMSHGLIQGMLDAERRIRLKVIANRRRRENRLRAARNRFHTNIH